MVNEKHILKTRVYYINGHYGLPVFADLATEVFFSPSSVIDVSNGCGSSSILANLSDYLCNFGKPQWPFM